MAKHEPRRKYDGTNPSRLLVLILSDDSRALSEARDVARRAGLETRLVCPLYDIFPIPHVDTPIAWPMDYLDEADVDLLYDELLEWQRRLPAVEIARGTTLFDWGASRHHPPVLWSWLTRLIPPVHLRMRLIDTTIKILEVEQPRSVVVIGDDPALPWARTLIGDVVRSRAPDVDLLPHPEPVVYSTRQTIWARAAAIARTGRAVVTNGSVPAAIETRVNPHLDKDWLVRRLFRRWGLPITEVLLPPAAAWLVGSTLRLETRGSDASIVLRQREKATSVQLSLELTLNRADAGEFFVAVRSGVAAETVLMGSEWLRLLSSGETVPNRWGDHLDVVLTIHDGWSEVRIGGERVLASATVPTTTESAIYIGHSHSGEGTVVSTIRSMRIDASAAADPPPPSPMAILAPDTEYRFGPAAPVPGPARSPASGRLDGTKAIDAAARAWGMSSNIRQAGPPPEATLRGHSLQVVTRASHAFILPRVFRRNRVNKIGVRLRLAQSGGGAFFLGFRTGRFAETVVISPTSLVLRSSGQQFVNRWPDEVRLSLTVGAGTAKLKVGDDLVASLEPLASTSENALYIGHIHSSSDPIDSEVKVALRVGARLRSVRTFFRWWRLERRRSIRWLKNKMLRWRRLTPRIARRWLNSPLRMRARLRRWSRRRTSWVSRRASWIRRRVLSILPARHNPYDDALERLKAVARPPGEKRHSGHAVLVMRGRGGSRWAYSSSRQQWTLWDEYTENLPEALIDRCKELGWRLTIIYDGLSPEFDSERRSYSSRVPDFVDELVTADLASLFTRDKQLLTRQYSRKTSRLLADPRFQAEFSHRGVSFFGLMEERLRRDIARLSAHCVMQTEGWETVFEALEPDIVISGRLELKPFISTAAHRVGALAVTVKLGVGEEMLSSIASIRPDGSFDEVSYPDLLLLWGEDQARYLTRRLPELAGRVAVSGRTRNDTFVAEVSDFDVRQIRRRLGIDEDAAVVVFGGTSRTRYGQERHGPWGTCCLSPTTYLEALKALANLADRHGRVWVIVKPHPADDITLLQDAVSSIAHPRMLLVTTAMGFHNSEILAASHVFASSLSSMFSEAVLAGCPSVNLWTPDVSYLYEAARCRLYERISVTVRSVADMVAAVESLLLDEDLRRRELARATHNMERLFGPMDGKNAARGADISLAMAETHRTQAATPREPRLRGSV